MSLFLLILLIYFGVTFDTYKFQISKSQNHKKIIFCNYSTAINKVWKWLSSLLNVMNSNVQIETQFFHVWKIWTKIFFFYYSRTKPWLLGNFIWMKSSEKSTGQTLPTYRPRSTSVETLDTSHPLLHLVAELSSRTVNPSPKKSEFRGKRPSVCKYNVLVFCHRKSFQIFFFFKCFSMLVFICCHC